MVTNKNDIIAQLSDGSSSDEQFYIGPENLSSSSSKSWTPQHERQGNMDKGKSYAVLAKFFDGPSFPFSFIGITSG